MHACTITSRRYSAHARVVTESFLEHNPSARMSILSSDGSEPEGLSGDRVEILQPADIGLDDAEFHRRATMYGAQGLAGSMKAPLLASLLSRNLGPVVCIDADGCVYADLEPVAELAQRHAVALSPHLPDPVDETWGDGGVEQLFLRAGVFNGGLVAVGPGAEPFLRWWGDRVSRRCIFDEPRSLLVEQTWLSIVPAFFEHGVLRERGVNVAGWNLVDRDVRWDGAVATIDGEPLRHFHFACSYDPRDPGHLTRQEHAHWWPTLEQRPGVARLSQDYAQRLLAHGYLDAIGQPVRYDAMPDGRPIQEWMRASYRSALMDAERRGDAEPPNPFGEGSDRFSDWLQSRARERAGSGVDGTVTDPAPSAEQRELATAMMNAHELTSRIGELETIRDDAVTRIGELETMRDDAIAWAQRRSTELQDANRELERLLAELAARPRGVRSLIAWIRSRA